MHVQLADDLGRSGETILYISSIGTPYGVESSTLDNQFQSSNIAPRSWGTFTAALNNSARTGNSV